MNASRLFHTVRHLRPIQIWGRVLTHLPDARVDPSPAPALRLRTGVWRAPVKRPRRLFQSWRVVFLGEEGEIAMPRHWNDPAKPKLWLYNLHYFDDLAAPAGPEHRALQRRLVSRWIKDNPPGHGNGWEPYPLSLRIASWIKWSLSGERLEQRWLDSLAVQVRWLSRHVEWHLLGNHLLANAKALVMAGLYFDGDEAERWLAQGLSIYAREIPQQILADGGHFELSPMYHAIILEDLLDILDAARTFGRTQHCVIAALPEVLQRMRAWLAVMTHPDGGPAFFNDCAFGIAASRADLEAFATRLALPPIAEPGDGLHHLATSGYVRLQQGDGMAILDIAAVGPDYLPGHAHADTLSFELSIGGERVIVNGGTSTYANSPQRHLERSTSSHSTVEIDGANSSEVWSAFRVARRARVFDVVVDRGASELRVSASHDGYRRLPGRPLQTRTWRMSCTRLQVIDSVAGPCNSAVARFLTASGARVEMKGDQRSGGMITSRGLAIDWTTTEVARVERSEWRPEFGKRSPTHCLTIPFGSTALNTMLAWN